MISVLLITYNEEKNIKLFIENVSFASEIIIVDSYSTDKTIKIAKLFKKVKVFYKKFNDFSSQKNYAISLANYKWILFLDTDELINSVLKKEILFKIYSKKYKYDAYYLKERYFFMNKKLKYGGFKNKKSIKLFKKNKCFFDKHNLVHEKIICKGKIGILKNKFNHYTYNSWEQFNKKLTKYAKIQSEEIFKKGIKPNFFHFIIKPFYRFINHYIIKGGILDGEEGLFISYLYSSYVFKRYVFLWMKYRKIQ